MQPVADAVTVTWVPLLTLVGNAATLTDVHDAVDTVNGMLVTASYWAGLLASLAQTPK